MPKATCTITITCEDDDIQSELDAIEAVLDSKTKKDIGIIYVDDED